MIAVPAGENTALIVRYVSDKVGVKLDADLSSAMAILNANSDFVAGVVFSEFRDTDVQLSTASESPVAWTDNVLRAIFDYTFNQLGCVRCTAVVKKGNRKARAFLEHLGFQLEGNIRLGYDGVKDALIYGLLASECRYLEPIKDADNGQEEQAESADSARSRSLGEGARGAGFKDSDLQRQSKPH